MKNQELLVSQATLHAKLTSDDMYKDVIKYLSPEILNNLAHPLFFCDLLSGLHRYVEDMDIEFEDLDDVPEFPDLMDEKYEDEDEDSDDYIIDVINYLADMLLKQDSRIDYMESVLFNNQFEFYEMVSDDEYEMMDIDYFARDYALLGQLKAYIAVCRLDKKKSRR